MSIGGYIYAGLGVVIAALLCLFLWERAVIVKDEAKIVSLQITQAEMQGKINDYEKNIKEAKATEQRQHKIAAELAIERQKISDNKTACIGGDDEKTLDSITYYFNNGMYADRSAETSGKVLPTTGKTGIDNSGKPRWQIKMLIENYFALIEYALELKATVECQEAK
jgi:hypothetical protein